MTLVEEGVRRSATLRSLLERLGRSKTLVYLTYSMLPSRLSGRLTLIGTAGQWRYLRIEIECRQSRADQISALGHELQHAIEIAESSAIVGPQSVRALYEGIGFATDGSGRHFESAAARNIGTRVRREVSVVIARRQSATGVPRRPRLSMPPDPTRSSGR
jgi:hypothetical protein